MFGSWGDAGKCVGDCVGQGGCKNVGGCGVSDCSDVCVRVSHCSVGGWLCW